MDESKLKPSSLIPEDPIFLKNYSLAPERKQSFITDMSKFRRNESPVDKIYEYYHQLKGQIVKLDDHIDNVLQKHESDFLSAFKCQTYQLYLQLKELKKKTDESELKLKQEENVVRLEKSLEWFRAEALRLGENAQQYKKEADKWKARAESLEEDRKFLEEQLKNAKRKIKKLSEESSQQMDDSFISYENNRGSSVRPTHASINEKQFMPSTSQGHVLLEIKKKFRDCDPQMLYEIETYLKKQEAKFQDTIKHFKSLIDNTKKKIKVMNAQNTSNIIEKGDLEDLFLDCIEEVRKEVISRREKMMIYQRFTKRSSSSSKVRKNEFAPNDKKKILELLVSNEQVLVFLYEKLFPRRGNQMSDNLTFITDAGEDLMLVDTPINSEKLPAQNREIKSAFGMKPSPPKNPNISDTFFNRKKRFS